ncbi:MAG: bifunctional demethylmenaquinone methyltransferase/2-methoxy-6-polyprenyl-1,4-benzoquinol methylase UbiE [Gammaproteobacteria bacterium]|nr:bifunctional demethylmenaquinone methyltransferase/2-methoxy-6-polyprenyl-1,4-benzoquinol methylase UbiE [Gammaproteobacteria bacterium]
MDHQPKDKQTHFGFRRVSEDEKTNLVTEVFASVAPKYDLMNDLMSFGLHRQWKRFAVNVANIRWGQRVLDAASGTGDLAFRLAKKVGPQGIVIATDINGPMLNQGRDQFINGGMQTSIEYVQATVEALPFLDDYFDCITIAFGLRNVVDKPAALSEFYRILKPGGQLLILEFSKPHSALLNKVYDFYSFNIIPKLGEFIVKDRASYQYLVESIRMHPDQDALKTLMQQAHFDDVKYFNLNGGIVALHQGKKY